MALLPFLGKEFMPPLQEGSLVFRAGSIPSTSLEQTLSTSKQAETVLLTFPQVQTALSHLGRSDRGEEAMDVNKFEVFVALKPQESLPEKIGYAELSREMQEHLERALPTSVIDATQPIQMRVKELISGVKASLTVKLYGRDLDTLEQLSEKIKGALQTVPGAW